MAIQEKSAQTFLTGAVLIQDAAAGGKVTEGGTNPSRILGVAEEDGHNVTTATASDVTHFAAAFGDTIFVGNLSTGQATDLNYIGNRYGITKVGNNWTVDTSKTGTTTSRVFIVDLDRRDSPGDIQGRVLFCFMQDYTAFGSTS
jgi:hypothetical protein